MQFLDRFLTMAVSHAAVPDTYYVATVAAPFQHVRFSGPAPDLAFLPSWYTMGGEGTGEDESPPGENKGADAKE